MHSIILVWKRIDETTGKSKTNENFKYNHTDTHMTCTGSSQKCTNAIIICTKYLANCLQFHRHRGCQSLGVELSCLFVLAWLCVGLELLPCWEVELPPLGILFRYCLGETYLLQDLWNRRYRAHAQSRDLHFRWKIQKPPIVIVFVLTIAMAEKRVPEESGESCRVI